MDRTSATVWAIARQFCPTVCISRISPLGHGHINDTFLVELESSSSVPIREGLGDRFVLQRINDTVFPEPELVIRNMRRFLDCVQESLQRSPMVAGRRWEVPVLLTSGTQDFYRDADQKIWRAMSFIAKSRSRDQLESVAQAQEVGFALGTFHRLVQQLPAAQLADTLPGFHITPQYLAQFDQVHQRSQRSQTPELMYGLEAIAQRRQWASVLETAKAKGILQDRIIHGDPKINNILFDAEGHQAIAFVDLDTVKPGLLHYDIGDCVRSACNLLGGSTREFDLVRFDLPLCRSLLAGYLSQAKSFLSQGEREYLFEAIRLLPFELGLRYITDYLDGDRYFKVSYPTQNLDRAMVQFKLLESVEQQETVIRDAITAGLQT